MAHSFGRESSDQPEIQIWVHFLGFGLSLWIAKVDGDIGLGIGHSFG